MVVKVRSAIEKWSRAASIKSLRDAIDIHQKAIKRVSYKGAKMAMRREIRVMKRVLAERTAKK